MSARLCVIDYMGKEPVPNVPVATVFVREVIGCNCPDEVFRQTAIQRGSSAGKACSSDCELRIGGRLLIVITSKSAARLSSHLVEVVAEGNRARDESKFNRFRLVVQTENAAQEPQWPRADYFKVRAVNEREYLLKHDLEADAWFLGQQW